MQNIELLSRAMVKQALEAQKEQLLAETQKIEEALVLLSMVAS